MKEARPANIRSLLLTALILSSSAFRAQAYYHPDEGRWLSRDPIGELGGQNLYGFVRNGPISRYDLFGLETLSQERSGNVELYFYKIKGDESTRVPSAYLQAKVILAVDVPDEYKKDCTWKATAHAVLARPSSIKINGKDINNQDNWNALADLFKGYGLPAKVGGWYYGNLLAIMTQGAPGLDQDDCAVLWLATDQAHDLTADWYESSLGTEPKGRPAIDTTKVVSDITSQKIHADGKGDPAKISVSLFYGDGGSYFPKPWAVLETKLSRSQDKWSLDPLKAVDGGFPDFKDELRKRF